MKTKLYLAVTIEEVQENFVMKLKTNLN